MMHEVISDRYKKSLVTVAMGFRTEQDIKKNGLYRFTKKEGKDLINFVKQLFNKNNSVLALKIKPTGYRSQHIHINSEKDLDEFINDLNNIFGGNNEIWVVQSSVVECWRCRIYLSIDDANDMIEMAYSYDDHILDYISSDSNIPYVCYKKEDINYNLYSNNLDNSKIIEVNNIIHDILNRFSNELKKVKEDLYTMGINGISLDIRVNNGYDVHDFDVSYADIKKVINYYLPQMIKQEKFSDHVLKFNKWLANISLDLPDNYRINNPFNGENKEQIKEITELFYQKYYNDNHKRYLILGSSPARKGTATTGIPFEDASHLYSETGIMIDNFYINKSSSNFLYDVMEQYGGCEKFYHDFFMSFVCPLGIVNKNSKGNEVNANYYENKKLENALYDFMVDSIKKQIAFGIDTSICYCIGSGENFKFLTRVNEQYKFFNKIVSLEHPRFIMQYNSKNRDKYLKKYITELNDK